MSPDTDSRLRINDTVTTSSITISSAGPGPILNEDPGSRQHVEEKFRRLAGVVLPLAQGRRLLETLRRLPALPDVGALAAMTGP